MKTKWDTANAAAYSAAMSLPGLFAVILYAGRAIVMSSGLPQYPWSGPPSPTFYFKPSFSSILATVNDVLKKFKLKVRFFVLSLFLRKVTWERVSIKYWLQFATMSTS